MSFFAPYAKNINPFLYKHSFIYRRLYRFTLKKSQLSSYVAVDKMKEDMAKFKKELDKESIGFSVIVSPIILPYRKWSDIDKQSRKAVIGILKDLNIRYFDLLPALTEALDSGVSAKELSKDSWHPSNFAAGTFAQYLYKENILKKEKD